MEPIYDAKVNKIIEMLKYKTRDEIATELEYKSYKSLDMYMRRKNFVFDSETCRYIPKQTKAEKMKKDFKSHAPPKIANIINAFEEDADPKLVAKQNGFKDHKEMARYMKNKGYEWNVYKNNYIKTVGKIDEKIANKVIEETTEAQDTPTGTDEYIHFMQFLYEKRDTIYQLISGTKEDGKMPRYVVPGITRTKAIYMSDMVARLIAEFSQEKNITQREIAETALIEFLQKYGYKNEVEALLKNG